MGEIQVPRNFFEDYAKEVELSDWTQWLYPGNFAPDWEKAVVATLQE